MSGEQKRSVQFIDMTEGNLVSTVFLFALPLLAGNVLQQAYYLADSAVIGRFVGINALAATNSCSWVTWTLNALGRDLSGAFAIIASIAAGRKIRRDSYKITANALMATAVVSVLVTLLLELSLERVMDLFRVQPQIRDMTRIYLLVVVLGIPFSLFYNTCSALLRAEGNSRITFYAITAATILNIVLDLVFVVGMNGGVFGAALATIIAQAVSAGIVANALIHCELFTYEREYWRFDVGIVKESLRLFFPMFANSLVIAVGGSMVSRTLNGIGTYMTAGIAAGTRIFTLLEAAVMSIQAGLSVFIGQNLGAGRKDRIRNGVFRVVLVSLLLTAAFNLVLQPLAGPITAFFLSNSDPALVESTHRVAVHSIRYLMAGMFIMTPMYLYRNSVQTMGHPVITMYTAFLQLMARAFSVYVPWAVTLPVVYIAYQRLARDEAGVN